MRALPGVADVSVEMTARVRSASQPAKGQPPLPGVKNVIAVGAGKGGVGKTTVSVNLALALAKWAARVGVLDGDIYGPNVPIMLGLNTQLTTDGKQIVPAEKYGVQVVSIGFLTKDDDAIIWRGPMLHGAIQQFFKEVAWNDLDYLIVDMPPGTGDVALSLSQTVPVVGAIVVTTPQKVSLADSRRAIRMYQKLDIPTIGVVENMSFYACPNCHHESDIFGHGGGEALATDRTSRSSAGCRCISRSARAATGRAAGRQRAGIAGGAGVRARRRAHGGAGVDVGAPGRRGQQGPHPPDPGPMSAAAAVARPAVHTPHARQRARRHRARGPPRADRRREPLVPRRVEERTARHAPGSRISSST